MRLQQIGGVSSSYYKRLETISVRYRPGLETEWPKNDNNNLTCDTKDYTMRRSQEDWDEDFKGRWKELRFEFCLCRKKIKKKPYCVLLGICWAL